MRSSCRTSSSQVRQKIPIGEEFEATSNLRNEAMFKEVRSLQFRQAMGSYQSPFDFADARAQASDFSMLLKVMEKDMVALEKQIEGRSGGTRRVLGSSLVTPSWVMIARWSPPAEI